MKKPLILITNSSNREEPMGEGARIIHCPYAYGAAIAAAGGIPVQTMEFAAEELADLCDGLLLSGGEDVDPARYGETILNDTVIADTRRDAYEFPLAKAFLDRGKPILAICRGFQVLNVVLGGDLWQDLPEQLGFIHSNSKLRHPCFTEEGSIIREIFGAEFKVNSTHHQAVRRLGEGLKVTGRSIEGIVEAYEHETLPIIGTQFHPERLTGGHYDGRTPDFAPWFERFIKMVVDNSSR
ncbi:MAG: gamma-glutamyl-gamma-aminobutyrate hydrolase family protein [Oscillospiraceae bacterium]|nr:gamma-glutamyl-gamma-aminobutyrate hydrolase family protein [Oscillospiraceae bacterium]